MTESRGRRKHDTSLIRQATIQDEQNAGNSITLKTINMNSAESVMMTQVKISIVVPCYNVEKYLPRCLDSLLNQTMKEIEIICINDGSPDRSIDVLHDYKKRYPKKIIIIDKSNEGIWKARLDGISQAQGDYIGFVDGDDFVDPEFCQELYNCAIKKSSDIVVCGFSRIQDETKTVLSTELASPRPAILTKNESFRLIELNGAMWNKLFKKSLLQNLPRLKNPPRTFEDIMMQLLAFPNMSRIDFVPKSLVSYTVRNNSLMTSTMDETKMTSVYNAMIEVKRYYNEAANTQLQNLIDAEAFLHLGISLMLSASRNTEIDMAQTLHQNKAFLSRCFPSWKTNAVISFKHACQYRGALMKTYFARLFYKAGLMSAALSLYRIVTAKMNREIKW